MPLTWEKFKELITDEEVKEVIVNDIWEKAGLKVNTEYLQFIQICAMISSNPKEFSACLVKAEHGIPIVIKTKKGERKMELKDYGLLRQKFSRDVILKDLANLEDVARRAELKRLEIEKKLEGEANEVYKTIKEAFFGPKMVKGGKSE